MWFSLVLKDGKDIIFLFEKDGVKVAIGQSYFKVNATIKWERDETELELSLKENNEFSIKIKINF